MSNKLKITPVVTDDEFPPDEKSIDSANLVDVGEFDDFDDGEQDLATLLPGIGNNDNEHF